MPTDSPAVVLGRLGGLARAKSQTKAQLSAIGRLGGLARARLAKKSKKNRKKVKPTP